MPRRSDWVARLHEALDAAERTPFDPGTANCGLFAADVIDAMVDGSSRAAELREQFKDTESAAAFLNREGGIEAAVTARLGPPVSWPRAMRGDVCLVETLEGPALGVSVGERIALRAPGGLAYVKLDKALAAWSVI